MSLTRERIDYWRLHYEHMLAVSQGKTEKAGFAEHIEITDAAAERDRLRESFPWDRREGLPDVPVLQSRYDAMLAEIATLTDQRDQATADVVTLTGENSNLQSLVLSLQGEVAETDTTYWRQYGELVGLRERFSALEFRVLGEADRSQIYKALDQSAMTLWGFGMNAIAREADRARDLPSLQPRSAESPEQTRKRVDEVMELIGEEMLGHPVQPRDGEGAVQS